MHFGVSSSFCACFISILVVILYSFMLDLPFLFCIYEFATPLLVTISWRFLWYSCLISNASLCDCLSLHVLLLFLMLLSDQFQTFILIHMCFTFDSCVLYLFSSSDSVSFCVFNLFIVCWVNDNFQPIYDFFLLKDLDLIVYMALILI